VSAGRTAKVGKRNLMQQESNSQKNDDGYNAKWFGIATEFVGVLAVFCYIGYKLDKALDSSPWFLLTGFAVGFTGMFYTILKQSRKIWRK
jgi:F0F1-type ATP synthase assembly protein I